MSARRKLLNRVLVTGVLAALIAPAAAWADDDNPTRMPPTGSLARQLWLKTHLRQAMNGQALASSMDHNRRQWDSLPPEQRDHYRREALAFMSKSPAEREKLIAHYEKLVSMSAEKQAAFRQRGPVAEGGRRVDDARPEAGTGSHAARPAGPGPAGTKGRTGPPGQARRAGQRGH